MWARVNERLGASVDAGRTRPARTSARLREIILVADSATVIARFRRRRTERAAAGEADVAADIPSERVDEVIGWAAGELESVAAARPHARVIDADGDIEAT